MNSTEAIPPGIWTDADRMTARSRYRLLGADGASLRPLVSLAAASCALPQAALLLHDGDRLHCTNDHGLDETTRRALCQSAAASQNGAAPSPHALLDGRFQALPLVCDGLPFGLLCVGDSVAVTLGAAETEHLRAVGRQLEQRLELACLRQSQQADRQLLEGALDFAIIAVDLDGHISRWNSGAERLLGWSREEMAGQSLALIYTEQDRAQAVPEQEFDTARREGSSRDERWHRRKHGEPFWAQGDLMLLRDDQGQPTGYLKILRDRTDLFHQIQAAREAEDRYRALVDLSPQLVCTFDPHGQMRYLNAYWCEYTGLTLDESLGDGWQQAIPVHERAAVVARWQRALEANVPYSLELPVRGVDGSVRWYQERGVPLLDAEGKVTRWIAVALDIDLRRRSEARRLESEAFTRLLLDSASEAFFSIDQTGVLTLCNDAFVGLLGRDSKRELIGQALLDVLPHGRLDDGLHNQDSPILTTARSGKPAFVEHELFFRLDGLQVPVEYRVSPIYREGELQGAICTATDITERVRIEAVQAFLLELSDLLQETPEPGQLGGLLCGRLGALLGIDQVGYGRLADGADITIEREWSRQGRTHLAGPHTLNAALVEALAAGAPVPIEDLLAPDQSSVGAQLAERLHCRSLLLAPLPSGEADQRLLLFVCREPHRWRPADLALVREVAERIRMAHERAQAAQALREAEQRIVLANEIASIGVWEYNATRYTLHWDTQLKSMAGLRADQRTLEVDDFLDRVHPDDRELVVMSMRNAFAPGDDGEVSLEYRILDPRSGGYYWLANRGRRVDDPSGEQRILGTARIITAERNFAERLLRMNALLEEQIEERRVAEQRQAAFIELGDLLRGQPDSGVIACAAVRVLGNALELNQAVFVSIDPTGEHASLLANWSDGTPSALKEVFRLDEFGDVAYDLQRSELVVIHDVAHDARTAPQAARLGEERVQSLVCLPLLEQGRLRAALLLLDDAPRQWSDEDVSFIREVADRAWTADERMRAERALRESEEQFRTLADNMSQFAWMADPDGRIYWYNKRWYDYTGTTLEAMRALGWRTVVHPEHLERVLASMRRSFAIGSIWEETFPLRGKDGRYRWFLSRALPIRDDLGRVTHWFGTNTDVTAQVAAEEALRDLNDSLERRVEERTRELAEINRRLHVEMAERERAEEALRHAQKMEAIGQLTGGLAHDFNNMLTGVLGALDLIQRRAAAGRVGELDRYIDAAVTSANRAAALTHRLLAFARRQSLDPKPVDVNHLAVSMEDMLRRTIGEHIALTTRLDQHLWLAYSDAHQLENALLNLVINARDAMPDGGRLTIETRNLTVTEAAPDCPEPGDYAVLCVTDSGAGMPDEIIAKAFDPFFTTKPIGQGTGLGLSMVYGFVKQTGGHVRIDSQVGEGTRITLYLPRQLAAASDETAPESQAAEVPRAQAGETVLVVEDEAAVRMLVVEVLEELGYGALEAFDGPSALPYLEGDQRIDLLVTDVGLPGMNGRQLAEIARQHRPDLKVLFITGYAASAQVRGDFLEEGMEMLAKPFNIDALGVRIRHMIEGD